MKLNLNLLADSLREKFDLIKEISKHEELILDQVLLFAGETTFLSGKIYVGKGDELPKKPFFSDACAVVSIGSSEKAYLSSDCDYIELKEDESISEVLNSIQEVFSRYTEWRLKLREAVFYERGVQELVDLTLPLLGNPIYCHDIDYRVLAYAEIPGMPGGENNYHISNDRGRLSLKALSELKNTPNFEKTFKTVKPTYFIDAGECSYIYDNIWLGDKYWGRIFVDERVKPFKKGDFAIIGELRHTVELALSHRNLFPGSHHRLLERELVRMLDGETVDWGKVEEGIAQLQWERDDIFLCFQIQMGDVDIRLNMVVNTCDMIESNLKDGIVFPYKNHIVGLVNVGGEKCGHDATILEALETTLRELDMHTGMSLQFRDLYRFHNYFTQTSIALEYGIREDSAELTHHFEDYSFPYMLDCCVKQMAPDMLAPSALRKLINYDRENTTSYVETLRVYLENESSPAKAMKKLFVQRSTFLYRLDRINEIMGIDHKDAKTKIHFLIAFQLMDRYYSAQNNPSRPAHHSQTGLKSEDIPVVPKEKTV